MKANMRRRAKGVSTKVEYPPAKRKIPYRSLAYYVGRPVRIFAKENPLMKHPAIYEGTLSGVFENPSALLLEDACALVLDLVPMQNYYSIVKQDRIGAFFIRMDEIRYFEIVPEGSRKLRASKGYKIGIKTLEDVES